MKYLFLVIGGGIFFNSLGAYREIGSNLFGGIGSLMAIAVFLIVQGFEAKPIIMTGGGVSPLIFFERIVGGKNPNAVICDPEELADATDWAGAGYAIDFACGLLVWPVVTLWDLVWIGGVSWGDVRWGSVAQIIACVFLLQICLAQYLRRGGKVPFSKRMGVAQ